MSDLQIGLIVLGVTLILMVLVFNWWQDHRMHRRMRARFPTHEQDPLLGDTAVRQEADSAACREAEAGATMPASHATTLAEAETGEEVDPVCEVVIEVVFAQPVLGAALLSMIQSMRQVGDKSIRFFGQTDQQCYHAGLQPNAQYTALQIAVLLANRSGPLTAIEWSQVWLWAQGLAERFDAVVDGPDQQVVLGRATLLDETCAVLDTQVGLSVLLNDAKRGADVLAVAHELGFILEGPRLAWKSEGNFTAFTLSRGDGQGFGSAELQAVERLDLLLDVPCSPPHERPFSRMVEIGSQLAQRLRAELVDDQGKTLAGTSIAVIDRHLQALFDKLEQAGLRAGSERARRVFG
jgi:hypothetical protein